jgi:hypothetical protein
MSRAMLETGVEPHPFEWTGSPAMDPAELAALDAPLRGWKRVVGVFNRAPAAPVAPPPPRG